MVSPFSKLRQRMAQKREAMKIGTQWRLALEGRQALEAGLSLVDCPYALGTAEQKQWSAGWYFAWDRKNDDLT